MYKVSRALLSVSDKTGIVELARRLDESGVELISTGGTAAAIRQAGVPVIDVSEVTGFPEMMEGRVKTLHPMIHGGLLARLDNEGDLRSMSEYRITSIDLLISNLYPFERTLRTPGATHDEIVEQIDIGGPAMVRAAAKNYRFTAVVTDPRRYDMIVEALRSSDMTLSDEFRLELAREAFTHTAQYDTMVAGYLSGVVDGEKGTEPAPAEETTNGPGETLRVNLVRSQTLRYGENPHLQGALYGDFTTIFEQLHGKELSYNNILDADAAAKLVLEFEEPTVVIVKHNNPCGVGSGENILEAWQKALGTDPTSAFGGIVAVNRPLDTANATAINEIFTEVIIAPVFPDEVMELLRKKRDRRLVKADYRALSNIVSSMQWDLRSVAGGLLAQSPDNRLLEEAAMKVVTNRAPSDTEMRAMIYAWRVAKHVKSNAIVYAAPDRTLGIGAGQMSRIDSSITAARKAGLAGLDLKGSAVASDAFFPFADGLLEAVRAGATAVIQPGGSVRDQEVIDAANEHDIAMVMTGMRHFRH